MPINTKNRLKPLMKMRGYGNPLQMEENTKKRRLFFEDNTAAQKYIVIKRKDCENSFKGVSPFLIEKGLAMITANIKETQRLRSGDLLVLTSKEEGYIALMKATKMAEMPIVVEEHKFLNTCRGVIYSHDLMYVDTEEITMELKNQNVTKVERIKRKINGELKDTPLHILTFNKIELPTYIKAGFLRLDVRLYIPSPMRCHNCQRYGHTKTKCFRIPVCPKCAKQIPNGHEESDCNPIKCANCQNEHTVFDKKCPILEMEKQIIKIKTMDRITYFRAKEVYYRENANTTGVMTATQQKQTYSDALKANTTSEEINKQITINNNNNKTNNINSNNNSNSNNNNQNKNNNQNQNENNTNQNKINNNNNLNNNNQLKHNYILTTTQKQHETRNITNNENQTTTNKNGQREITTTMEESNNQPTTSRRLMTTTHRRYSFLNPNELVIAVDDDEGMAGE